MAKPARDSRLVAAEADLVPRALAAWFRGGESVIPGNESEVVEHEGHSYVVLRDANGILGVYRVRNDGKLKRLRRWPAELEND